MFGLMKEGAPCGSIVYITLFFVHVVLLYLSNLNGAGLWQRMLKCEMGYEADYRACLVAIKHSICVWNILNIVYRIIGRFIFFFFLLSFHFIIGDHRDTGRARMRAKFHRSSVMWLCGDRCRDPLNMQLNYHLLEQFGLVVYINEQSV